MGTNSHSMNAKLTTSYYLASPGSFIINEIYKTRANQNITFYRILGNKTYEKRIYTYEKYGPSYSTCR